MVTTALASHLLEMQVNENNLKNEIGHLSKRVIELSDSLKNVAYWILGIFTLFIPQIIFAFQQSKANSKLQKLNEKVKEVSGNIARLKNEINAAQIEVKALENQKKIAIIEGQVSNLQPSLESKKTVIITFLPKVQEIKKIEVPLLLPQEEKNKKPIEIKVETKAATLEKAANRIQKSYLLYKRKKVAKAAAEVQEVSVNKIQRFYSVYRKKKAAKAAALEKAANTIQRSYSVYKGKKVAKAAAEAQEVSVNKIQRLYSVYRKKKAAKAAALEKAANTIQRSYSVYRGKKVAKAAADAQHKALENQNLSLAIVAQGLIGGYEVKKEVKANKPGRFQLLVNAVKKRAETARKAVKNVVAVIGETGKEVGEFLLERPEVGLVLDEDAAQIVAGIEHAMNPAKSSGSDED